MRNKEVDFFLFHFLSAILPYFSQNKRYIKMLINIYNLCKNHLKQIKIDEVMRISKITIYIFWTDFRCLNKLSTEQFHTWFKTTSNTYTYNTRSGTQNNLYLPYARTTNYGQRSIKYHGPKIWNELPIHIKKIETYATFTSMLKHFLLSKYNET